MTPYTKQGTRYKPTTLSEQGAWGWQDLMVIAAFRYCLGRMTYITGTCADWLVDKWQQFPPNVQAHIRRELEEEFKRDDEDRATGASFKALGWDCDRSEWEKVRAIWNNAPPAEPFQPSPMEIAHRAKWLSMEMEAVGTAMLQTMPGAGRDLQDAASNLLEAIKDKT